MDRHGDDAKAEVDGSRGDGNGVCGIQAGYSYWRCSGISIILPLWPI